MAKSIKPTDALQLGRKAFQLAIDANDSRDWSGVAKASGYQVSKLAGVFGVSLRQVERLIRRRFEKTPRDWLRHERMRAAAQVAWGAASIKEISYGLGYRHPSHFNRHFRKEFGCIPSEFMRQISHNAPEDQAHVASVP